MVIRSDADNLIISKTDTFAAFRVTAKTVFEIGAYSL
jgi:hypothetical protein